MNNHGKIFWGMLMSALACMIISTGRSFADPLNLYVSPSGNDSWTGRLSEANATNTDGPFASLERARDEIRKLRQSNKPLDQGAKVNVRGGIYDLNQPFRLTQQDSGSEKAPIVYTAYSGEEVRLAGGKTITGFQPVQDAAILKRLDEQARNQILWVDLKVQGIADFGPANEGGAELFFDDQPMMLSRWPNEGFVRIADIVVQDGHEIHGHKGSKIGQFKYDGDRPARWIEESDPWLHGYWFWDWSDQRQKISSIDTANSIITLATPDHSYGYRKNQWYYALNMLSELDSPGEWYIDREQGILYFWPPQPIESAQTVLSILPRLIETQDTSFVDFRHFTLEISRDTAIQVSNGQTVQVADCAIRNTGGSGVQMSGKGHSVVNCEIYRVGKGGISLSGGDRPTLTPGGLYADNNHIHHFGRINRMYTPGIALNGVGNRATHNLIHTAPHIGIQFSGNENLMEFNEIHHVCMESNDAGAIYTGRNWTMRGNIIRYNYLHHINGFEERGCVGVYLDDMFSSAAIYGNVFYLVTRAAFIGGGRDCTIENNIFVDCTPAIHVDARAMGWAEYHTDEWIQEAKEKGTHLGIAYNKPPYSERYPQLIDILDENPKAPMGNLIARNICWRGKWDGMEEKAKPFLKIEDNLLDEDPLFVDADNLDFRLKPESPAFKLGFKAIPIEQIGLRKK